ncbi:MAG: 4Fe-4S binding protein [archaeon]
MITFLNSNKAKNKRKATKSHLAVFGRCSGCHYCVNACPEHSITENTPPIIDFSRCNLCMKCVKACPRCLIKLVD